MSESSPEDASLQRSDLLPSSDRAALTNPNVLVIDSADLDAWMAGRLLYVMLSGRLDGLAFGGLGGRRGGRQAWSWMAGGRACTHN